MAPIQGIQKGPFHMDFRAASQPSASKTKDGMTTTMASPTDRRRKGHVLVGEACHGKYGGALTQERQLAFGAR